MRLEAQMRGGFYPAPEEAVAHAVQLLRPPDGQSFTILDPCAGEGAAIRQLGQLLGCPEAQLFAIELDESRAAKLHQALSTAHVLAPASFFGCRAGYGSFSLVLANPPFDSAYGGLRVEEQFLTWATDWLMPGGVMALVCPEPVMDEYGDACQHFRTYYEHCRILPFPETCRKFNEVMVLAHKRARPRANKTECDVQSWESIQAPERFVYRIPPGSGPRRFEKVEPTEPELQQMIFSSPLRSHLRSPAVSPLPSPPLALGIGHIALLLASGHLDGVVQPEGKAPHVVRGTSRKRESVSDVTETANPDGSLTTKTTISERIELVVRTVDHVGTIRTFKDCETDSAAA